MMEYTILNSIAIPPQKNHKDCCYDIFSPRDIVIRPSEIIMLYSDINLRCHLEDFYIKLECKYNEEDEINILGGIIDKDYLGNLGIIIHNYSNVKNKIIKRGDIIAIARLLKYLNENRGTEKFDTTEYMPKKITKGSVAWDIYAPYATVIPPRGVVTISTNVKILNPSPYHIRYASRSGLASKHHIIVTYGDENGFWVLNNLSNNEYDIKKGHRIGQIIYEI